MESSGILRSCLYLAFSLILITGSAIGQQPSKVKRPVKNPPQYPNIIELNDRRQDPNRPPETQPAEGQAATVQSDALVQAVLLLGVELRSVSMELRALNLRGQAQLEMMRLSRAQARVDYFERELRSVRDRLASFEVEENNISQLMTRESLLAQTANIGTFNREQTMEQIRYRHDANLRQIQSEKERHQKQELDLLNSLNVAQTLVDEIEKRIEAAEEKIRDVESGAAPDKTQSRPQQ